MSATGTEMTRYATQSEGEAASNSFPETGDMMALGTAAAVAEGYVYTITAQCLWGVTAGVLALSMCAVLAQFRRLEIFQESIFILYLAK